MNLKKFVLKIGMIWIIMALTIGYSITPSYSASGIITDIVIQPPTPTDQDPIEITVSGEWGNPCFEIASSSNIYGNMIRIDVTIVQLPLICIQVVTPWEITESVGILSAGTYNVEAYLNGGLDYAATSFTVVPTEPVPPPPTLNVPGCDELAADQGSKICVPVNLVTNGARVASVGFALKYDCQVLHLPNGSQDVQPGSVLTEGQNVTAIVEENETCQVKVTVTPLVQIPIPVILDGDLVQICFMVKPGAPVGCSDITFVPGSVDIGDDGGQNIPVDQPTDGGVLVDCEPTGPEVCTGGIDEDCDGLIDCDDPDCLGDLTCSIDHFKCYKTKRGTEKFVPRDIKLSDQFEEKLTTVMSPVAICNPVDKEGEGINDPDTHLTCYKIKDTKTTPRQEKYTKHRVVASNQFGDLTLDAVKSYELCVPSGKNQDLPAATRLDHFKCYKARVVKGTGAFEHRYVKLGDQFEDKLTKVMNPVTICNPVDKEGEGIKDPNDHLTCYKIKDAKTEPRQDKFQKRDVMMRNQFGMDTLEVVKPLSLCVPSSKTEVGPAK